MTIIDLGLVNGLHIGHKFNHRVSAVFPSCTAKRTIVWMFEQSSTFKTLHRRFWSCRSLVPALRASAENPRPPQRQTSLCLSLFHEDLRHHLIPYERNCQHLPAAPSMNHDRLPTLCVDASGRALLNLGDQQEQQLGGRHGDGLRECLDSFLHGNFGWPCNLLGCLCGVLSQLRYQAAIAAGWPCFGGRFFRNHGCTVVLKF